jgi:hypothetical protein
LGQQVKADLKFVTFEKRNDRYAASLFLDEYSTIAADAEKILRKAENIYTKSLSEMMSKIAEVEQLRAQHIKTPARLIWLLGDRVFRLTWDLEKISLQINNLYAHLERDLKVKRKWLEKVIIFRRYIPDMHLIPKELNWGRCEKGTRKIAEALRDRTFKENISRGRSHKDGKL